MYAVSHLRLMFERPRGTRDFSPEHMTKFRHVEQVFTATARSFGFREVLTPTFEDLGLFVARSGPGVIEELYAFKDKAGRDLALRPEFTASVIRYYLKELRTLPKPIKVYSFGPLFRYEEPQKGRFREHWQLSCEVIGAPLLEADAELISLAMRCFQNLGVKERRLRIGHIGLLREFLKGQTQDIQERILHALDKRDSPRLQQELTAAGLQEHEIALTELVALKGGAAVLDQARNLLGVESREWSDYLVHLRDRLLAHGLRDEEIQFDLGVIRGLAYYTGMVFELDCPNLGAEKQIGGGGSYALAETFGGEAVPTSGFGLGVDRAIMAGEAEGLSFPRPTLDLYIVPVGEKMREQALSVTERFRKEGFSCDFDMTGRGPSKNLDYANAVGASFCLILGEREWAKGTVALKDMASGEQTEMTVEKISAAIRSPRRST